MENPALKLHMMRQMMLKIQEPLLDITVVAMVGNVCLPHVPVFITNVLKKCVDKKVYEVTVCFYLGNTAVLCLNYNFYKFSYYYM